MVLLDSNIVIYSAQAGPEFDQLRNYLIGNPHCVSLITFVEVLGFHGLDESQKALFYKFFEATEVLPVTDEIAHRAVRLKQRRRMKLGDALIAATAMENDLELVSRNTKDFKWIPNITLVDPFSQLD